MTFNLYVDGGGTTKVPTYFSYRCLEVESIRMERFYLVNLAYELLPEGCSIFNGDGLQTNNIAEFCALTYGLLRFKKFYDFHPVNVYQDSMLVVQTVNKKWDCKAEHLKPWVNFIHSIWWQQINLIWVPRKKIVEVLGH